ncbi:MAG: type II toxin-antitoxin system RelE/ParE family toxin [Myxococcales bacterium]|nr:type II toxin-antitoxin system RelE/ParE family toxin [Myxococcales bacterium]
MPKFDLSRRARRDLVEIGEYTAERWDDAQAEQYVSALYATCQRLAERLAVCRRCDVVRPGLWRIEHVSHVIFFRELPGGDLLVCRVLHARMLPEHHPIDDDEED